MCVTIFLSVAIFSCPRIQWAPTLDHNYTLLLGFMHGRSTLFGHVDVFASLFAKLQTKEEKSSEFAALCQLCKLSTMIVNETKITDLFYLREMH